MSSNLTSLNSSGVFPNTNSSFLQGNGSEFAEEAPSWPAYLPIYVTILNVAVFFTGTVGNVLVCVVVVMVRDMRTPMNWYLVNLSIADLFVLLFCQPAALVEFFARDRWLLGSVLCRLVPALEHASLHASTLIIISITVERYYAICSPLRTTSLCHRPHPLRVMPCVWTLAILTSVPFSVMSSLQDTTFYDGTPCQVCATSVKVPWHYVYIIGMSVLFLVLPMLLLLGLYTRIIQALKDSGASIGIRRMKEVGGMSTRRSRKQVIKMLVGIVVLFFVCLLPVRCVIIWQIFTPEDQIQGLGPEGYYNLIWISRLLAYMNSAGNPIIYSLMSTRFQEAFWSLLNGRRNQSMNRNNSMSSRASVSRWSVSNVTQNSLAPTVNSPWIGQGDRKTKMILRKMRTTSFSSFIAMQNSPASSPMIKNSKKETFVLHKQRSCISML